MFLMSGAHYPPGPSPSDSYSHTTKPGHVFDPWGSQTPGYLGSHYAINTVHGNAGEALQQGQFHDVTGHAHSQHSYHGNTSKAHPEDVHRPYELDPANYGANGTGGSTVNYLPKFSRNAPSHVAESCVSVWGNSASSAVGGNGAAAGMPQRVSLHHETGTGFISSQSQMEFASPVCFHGLQEPSPTNHGYHPSFPTRAEVFPSASAAGTVQHDQLGGYSQAEPAFDPAVNRSMHAYAHTLQREVERILKYMIIGHRKFVDFSPLYLKACTMQILFVQTSGTTNEKIQKRGPRWSHE